MRIIIARPQDWIDRSKSRKAKIWFYDVEALYNGIEEACKNLGVKYEVSTRITPGMAPGATDDKIILAHHTYGYKPNVWHIKKGYCPNYMYWDKFGYSGWSELAESYIPKKYSEEECNETLKYISNYITSNKSKIQQPDEAKVPNHPYILVLCQRPYDTVAKHSYITTLDLPKLVETAYQGTGYAVYTKPHPMYRGLTPGKKIEGSLHKLVNSASAVYTVNSGAGFESLFHGKHVFVSGKVDYQWECTIIKNLSDIISTKSQIVEPINWDKRIQFLTYCFQDHFVNTYDLNSITKKIKRCIDEYEVSHS